MALDELLHVVSHIFILVSEEVLIGHGLPGDGSVLAAFLVVDDQHLILVDFLLDQEEDPQCGLRVVPVGEHPEHVSVLEPDVFELVLVGVVVVVDVLQLNLLDTRHVGVELFKLPPCLDVGRVATREVELYLSLIRGQLLEGAVGYLQLDDLFIENVVLI